MRKIVFLPLVSVFILSLSCKDKEVFNEPEILLNRWAEAAEHLDYNLYAGIEAYPKSRQVFYESFSGFYPSEVRIIKVEDLDPDKVYNDHKLDRYYRRNVKFQFTQINRGSGLPEGPVVGDVDFIKYIDGVNNDRGWIMLNRTMIRVFEQ